MLYIKKNDSGFFLIFCLLISVFFPLLPFYFGNSPIHLVPLNFILAVFLLFFSCIIVKKISLLFVLWLFVFFFQYILLNVALLLDVITGDVGFSGFFGTFKPLYSLLFLYVGYCIKYDYSKFESLLEKYFVLVLFITLIVAFYEIFLITDGSIFYSLYKREDRYILDGKSTSWFGVTYYHSYFFLLFFCYFHFLKWKGKKYYVLSFLSILLVVASQSRTMIISLFFLLVVFVLIDLLKKPILFFRIFIFLILMYLILDFYFLELKEHFWYFFVLYDKFMRVEFYEFLFSGSIGVRLDQISDAFVKQNYLWGAGLGRINTPLESIYASYTFRFGIFWAFFFISFYVFFGFYFVIKSKNKFLMKSIGYFWILTPFTMFASPMIDFPKINFLILIITGYLLRHSYAYPLFNKKESPSK